MRSHGFCVRGGRNSREEEWESPQRSGKRQGVFGKVKFIGRLTLRRLLRKKNGKRNIISARSDIGLLASKKSRRTSGTVGLGNSFTSTRVQRHKKKTTCTYRREDQGREKFEISRAMEVEVEDGAGRHEIRTVETLLLRV